MLFNSFPFFLFFIITALLYYIIPYRLRYLFLLAASLYFYMCWNPVYVLLLMTSIAITWVCASLISRSDNVRQRKLFLAFSFVSNLGILFFFKYYGFAVDSANRVLALFSLPQLKTAFDVLLPVGISFYTFQALGYTVDVYRGDVEHERNFLKYALFVSFFPQLVAGPIERSSNLLSQIQKPGRLDWERVQSGLIQMLYGYFQKVMISDNAAIIVNQVYDNYAEYGTVELVLATVLFSFQVYCDFGGYSNIAIGAARVMGFDLMENFNAPFYSQSIGEFWRRWHISLSSWFRDYLYIPLGGNRKGTARKYFNLMVIFFASGLWHGASWHYVAWGVLNGFYVIVGELTEPARAFFRKLLHIRENTWSRHFRKIVTTFVMFNISMVVFRAPGVRHAFRILKRIVTMWDPWMFSNDRIFTLGLGAGSFHALVAAIVVVGIVDLCRLKEIHLTGWLQEQECWFRWGVCLVLVLWILIHGVYGPGFDANQFIYFQF